MIIKNATSLYTRNQIKILNEQAEEKRRQAALAVKQKQISEGTYEDPKAGEEVGWGRGTKVAEAMQNRKEYDDKVASFQKSDRPAGERPPRRQAAPEDNTFARGDFKAGDKPNR